MSYRDSLIHHFSNAWDDQPTVEHSTVGPAHELPDGFCVLKFAPRPNRAMWTYSTCGMGQTRSDPALELHLCSPRETQFHVELLAAIAHYHHTGAKLGIGHSVNFGEPWLPGSLCDHGLISLPYLDGPRVELFHPREQTDPVHCCWLIPITRSERDFKKSHDLEALEQALESAQFNYLNPNRPSVV